MITELFLFLFVCLHEHKLNINHNVVMSWIWYVKVSRSLKEKVFPKVKKSHQLLNFMFFMLIFETQMKK